MKNKTGNLALAPDFRFDAVEASSIGLPLLGLRQQGSVHLDGGCCGQFEGNAGRERKQGRSFS
jgi:hypothetical protein